MSLKLNSSGGGSVTLSEPVTANNYTLTLPAQNSTLATVDGANTTFTSITDSGNLTFTGTGNRITGDFTNATVSSRVLFQNNSSSPTQVGAIGGGGNVNAGFLAYSALPDGYFGGFTTGIGDSVRFISGITGSGSYVPMIFLTGGSERMRIDTSGNVGIGGSPSVRLQVTTAAATAAAIKITDATNYTLVGGYAAANLGYFGGDTGSSFALYANGAEKARIDSSGIVYIGGTSGYGTTPTGLGVKSTSTNWQVICLAQPNANAACVINYVTPSTAGVGWDAGVQNNSTNWMFRYNASQISNINASTGVYTATSDVNRKKDFEESSIGLAEVMRLKPTLFRMLVDDESSEKELGFIAQDVKSVIPQAYVEDGDFIGLQDRPIIAALTKAIQEQQEQINQLKAEVAALKGV